MEAEKRRARNLALAVALSVLVSVGLLSLLVYAGGIWDILANTRLLDLLIGAGVVSYHDNQHGFIEGLPDLKYYLWSQDPVRWDLVVVVLVIFLIFYSLKAIQYHGIVRLFGINSPMGQSVRVYSYGMFYGKVLPFNLGSTATTLALEADGATPRQARAVELAADIFIIFEIVAFSALGFYLMGWSNGFAQIWWSLVILLLAVWVMRQSRVKGAEFWSQCRDIVTYITNRPLPALWLAGLSLLAFGLEDVAAYFTAMAFTSQHVILSVDFSLLLMAVVASYLARLVPITPGGLGQFEWGFAAALWVGGLALPEAATIAILDNLFRYAAATGFRLVTVPRHSIKTSLAATISATCAEAAVATPRPSPRRGDSGEASELPDLGVRSVPDASQFWWRSFLIVSFVLGVFYLDRLFAMLFDFWLLESLGYSSVFWTNFSMGLKLFVLGLTGMAVGISLPAFSHPLTGQQRLRVIAVACAVSSVGGYLLALNFSSFLLHDGQPFNQTDPVFGRDYGFYVYNLSNYWLIWTAVFYGTAAGLLSSVACAWLGHKNTNRSFEGSELKGLRLVLGILSTGTTRLNALIFGGVGAVGFWLTRYDLLIKDNSASAVNSGASYVDVVGLFSNLNYVYLTAILVLSFVVCKVRYLAGLHKAAYGAQPAGWMSGQKTMVAAMAAIIFLDFGFKGMVAVRDTLYVRPNEPVIQLDYIAHHLKATREGYKLDGIEEVDFRPNGPGAPAPDVDRLLASPTLKNAPLWPGFTAHLELWLDYQHSKRILLQNGDTTIYGPSIEIFRQQQKLRMYYDFLGVDSVRYRFNGEKRMFVSSVREAPLIEPYPWLAWFGQRYMLFTHGYGMAITPASGVTQEGEPDWVSYNIPAKVAHPELEVKNPRIYYGEGSATIAYSNVNGMKELDYPTDQGREQIFLPEDYNAGVKIDSLVKRLAYGWRSSQFFDVVFSDLIQNNTRVHFWRTPIERVERVAPFLFYDTNPYAVVADGQIIWMINGITWSDWYPYSRFEDLGDTSDERAVHRRARIRMNYLEDAVKATVDAGDGRVTLYKFTDAPVINTWAAIYPDLFVDKQKMPESVRAQITYPVQFMHAQFDDLYIYYHMNEPMYFFNQEDLLDDADEVVGPVIGSGQEVTFSIEPYNFLLETGKHGIPAAQDPVQYVTAMVFTPQSALNLRMIPMVYQDGEDYGKIVVLKVPKGTYYPGPEQADASTDQNPEIGKNLAWWNRRGTDVIRGHTSTLVVDNEVIYVEPIFIRSQQLAVTQMKKVVVSFRGVSRLGDSLEEALRNAVAASNKGESGGAATWIAAPSEEGNAPVPLGRDEGPGGVEEKPPTAQGKGE